MKNALFLCIAGTIIFAMMSFTPDIRLDDKKKTKQQEQNPSIKYIVHIRSDGWNQGWLSGGETAGRCSLVRGKKVYINIGDGAPIGGGLEDGYIIDDTRRIEGIKIKLENAGGASIRYKAHVQSEGWQNWVKDGELAGTEGQAKRLEAIIIELDNLPGYTIRYKVRYESKNDHIRTIGKALNNGHTPTVWSGWYNEGAVAGTTGDRRRLSHIVIELAKI